MQRERKRERREEKRKVPGRKKGFNYSARRNVLTRCTGNRLSSIYLPTINIKYYFELSACVPISFIGFVVLRLSLFSTRDDYLLQLTQNDLTHELTYKTFFLYFDISLRESYTLKRNLSTRRSFLSRHHLQRDHYSFESTCSDSEENYACMRPSFPGGKQGREKWLLYPFSVIKGVRDPDSLDTRNLFSEDCASSRGCYFFLFLSNLRLSPRGPSIQRARLE